MALEPENPAIGGTVLRRAAIQSPDFVHNVQGWTVNQDGSAEFNNLTIRGSFDGTDFIINDSGAFFYSGIPAHGNLIESITSGPGTDEFGNNYVSGMTVYDSSGNTIEMSDGQLFLFNTFVSFVATPAGIFMYHEPGGAGNLIASIAPSSGSDSNGNAYLSGQVSYFGTLALQIDSGTVGWYTAPSADGPWTLQDQLQFRGVPGAFFLNFTGDVVIAGNLELQSSIANSLYLNSGSVPSGAPPAAPAGAETWHPVTFANSWANTAGRTPAQYRFVSSPPNEVEIIGGITAPSGIAANQTVFTLPAGYRVAHTQSILAVDLTTGGPVRLSADGSGNINYQSGVAASGNVIDFHALLSLDA